MQAPAAQRALVALVYLRRHDTLTARGDGYRRPRPGGGHGVPGGGRADRGVGWAAVVDWRRRRLDFPVPVAGTDLHPRFPRPAVVAWLLAHDKIAVPTGVPSAALILRSDPTGERRFRLDDPCLELADDAADEDRLSGWTTDGGALAALTANEDGVSVHRPNRGRRAPARGTGPSAGDRPIPVRVGRPAHHPGVARRPVPHRRPPGLGRHGPPRRPDVTAWPAPAPRARLPPSAPSPPELLVRTGVHKDARHRARVRQASARRGSYGVFVRRPDMKERKSPTKALRP